MENEDYNKKRVHVSINNELYEEAKKSSAKLGISFSGFVNICISDRLKQDSVVDLTALFGTLQKQFEELGVIKNNEIENKNEEIKGKN